MAPEEERDWLAGAVNLILVRVTSDHDWGGDVEDRAKVQRYGELSRELNDLSTWADAAWLLSVMLERAGDLRGAERAAAVLQREQDLARRHVSQIGAVAKVTGRYRSLPPRLASLRYRLEAGPAAMFDAIEWAKCRALSDAAGDDDAPGFDALMRALAGSRTNYLSFLIDTSQCFAVLVTATGKAFIGRAPIGVEHVLDYAKPDRIRPEGRGRPKRNRFARPGDWRDVLAPLAELVDQAVAQGHIGKGETLLIAPHGLLHLFPLHELALPSAGGSPIGAHVAVARVHGAAAVLRCIAGAPPQRPRQAMVMRAPLAGERDDEAYVAAFRRSVALVSGALAEPATEYDAEQATAEAVLDAMGRDRLLHIACHGDVLRKAKRMERSILMLASQGELPHRVTRPDVVPAGALTPARLLRHAKGAQGNRSALCGSHVTLQACVSGHATANPQGDAVGLEWAFLIAGAASTLGTHWHVDRDDAARFVEVFHTAWLAGSSRASAWAAAGAALRDAYGDARWAAFSLTGEWR